MFSHNLDLLVIAELHLTVNICLQDKESYSLVPMKVSVLKTVTIYAITLIICFINFILCILNFQSSLGLKLQTIVAGYFAVKFKDLTG